MDEIVGDRGDAAVDMRLLAALPAIRAVQRRGAVKAVALAGVTCLAGGGLDRAGDHAAGHRLADAFYLHAHAPLLLVIMAQLAAGVESKVG